MTQGDRNKLYNLACGLDNHCRVRIPKKIVVELREVPEDMLIKIRMQNKLDGVFAVYSERELSAIADEIRSVVAYDESRLIR